MSDKSQDQYCNQHVQLLDYIDAYFKGKLVSYENDSPLEKTKNVIELAIEQDDHKVAKAVLGVLYDYLDSEVVERDFAPSIN
jgi:hypothetical protein